MRLYGFGNGHFHLELQKSPVLSTWTPVILLSFVLSMLIPPSTSASSSKKLKLNIDSSSDYLCYYGPWDEEKIERALDFDMVILEPSNITADQIAILKKGHDGISGTGDDVIVIGYLSIGEDHLGNRPGDGRGPCYYSYDSSKIIYENKGLASWYVDDKDLNHVPDTDPVWGSAYVNAGDTLWWNFLKTNSNGADVILNSKKCDGLFLDLVDIAMPWAPWPYRWTLNGMSDLIKWLRNTYEDKFLIANRGLFYFDPSVPEAYACTIRPYIDADMFESYYLESSRTSWAQKLNTEAGKPDGFKIISLDYFQPTDTASIAKQCKEVFSYNWTNYITAMTLDVIRYDVFHRHVPDKNPPTWDGTFGLQSVVAGDGKATLFWSKLTDQSLPLHFDLYYSNSAVFTIATANKLPDITPVYDSVTSAYSFVVTNLVNYTKYNFLIRVTDAAGNSEFNTTLVSATPPGQGDKTPIVIDGQFADWFNVPKLNTAPNPNAVTGSSSVPDADFINFWVTNDTNNLYISYQVAGVISSAYFYHIFIDSDLKRETGYIVNDSASIGAEVMVESNYLYKYTGTGGNNWSWSPVSGFEKKDNKDRTELKIPLSVLNSGSAKGEIRMFFNVNSAVSPYTSLETEPVNYKSESYQYTIVTNTAIDDYNGKTASNFTLLQNYPNPFNPATRIQYSLPGADKVKLAVYNVLGARIKTLSDSYEKEGMHAVLWNGKDDRNNAVPSGVYFIRLEAGNSSLMKKMVLVK